MKKLLITAAALTLTVTMTVLTSWPSTLAETYQQTTFDRLVGWSRWLLINESAPPAWSPSSFNFQLPSDDMSVNPNI